MSIVDSRFFFFFLYHIFFLFVFRFSSSFYSTIYLFDASGLEINIYIYGYSNRQQGPQYTLCDCQAF